MKKDKSYGGGSFLGRTLITGAFAIIIVAFWSHGWDILRLLITGFALLVFGAIIQYWD